MAVEVERAIVLGLEGDCHSPIAALASVREHTVELRVAVAHRGGVPPLLFASGRAPLDSPQGAAEEALESLRNLNVRGVLHGAS
jgi:porphobilinogen deaminase